MEVCDACHSSTSSLSCLRKGGRGLTTLRKATVLQLALPFSASMPQILFQVSSTMLFPCLNFLIDLPSRQMSKFRTPPTPASQEWRSPANPPAPLSFPHTKTVQPRHTLAGFRTCVEWWRLVSIFFHCPTDSYLPFQTLIFVSIRLTATPGQVSPSLFEGMAI